MIKIGTFKYYLAAYNCICSMGCFRYSAKAAQRIFFHADSSIQGVYRFAPHRRFYPCSRQIKIEKRHSASLKVVQQKRKAG